MKDALIERALNGRTPKARIVILDRSRVEARIKCPELRWQHYHVPVQRVIEGQPGIGYGVMRRPTAVPLATGIIVHHGLALFMQGASEDEGVREALVEYDKIVNTRGLGAQIGTPIGWTIKEQRALSEGLIRIGIRRAAAKLLRNYEVLAVEEEVLVWLGDAEDSRGGVTFLWAGRLDALLAYQGNASVLNWKTQKQWRDTDAERLPLDMQTAGEAWAAEQFYDRAVNGVQYIYLIKGERRKSPETGHKVTYSHVVRGWKAIDPLTGGWKYAWNYHKIGTKSQTLSKAIGFQTFEDFPGGMKGWIDALDRQDLVLPLEADPLEEVLRVPAAVSATPQKIERWQAQTIRDEHRWLLDMEDGRVPSRNENGYICGTGDWKCPMWEVCHAGDTIENTELYMPRDPNHPVEESIWG